MSRSSPPSATLPLDLAPAGKARPILGIAVVATMAGFLAVTLRGGGSGWDAWLFLERGLSHDASHRIDLALVVTGLVGAVAGLLLCQRRWGGCLMLPAFAYLLVNACLIARMGGTGHAEWTPAAHALRYGTPLALALLVLKEPFGEVQVTMLLRMVIALVFVTHGVEALVHYPRFIDLVIGSGENLLGWRINESQAQSALTVIGVVDVIAGLLVLARPHPALLWSLAAWGLITALSRMTSLGWIAYPELLTRATHFLVPLALVLCRRRSG
ncbi:MAG: hypothetical protein WD342_05240 [Verrucomicrobiales bacterium]